MKATPYEVAFSWLKLAGNLTCHVPKINKFLKGGYAARVHYNFSYSV